MLTLTAIHALTGVSMYKRRFADRIPSEGEGRSQRYPEEAVPVFAQLRIEQESRRGRPRKRSTAEATP